MRKIDSNMADEQKRHMLETEHIWAQIARFVIIPVVVLICVSVLFGFVEWQVGDGYGRWAVGGVVLSGLVMAAMKWSAVRHDAGADRTLRIVEVVIERIAQAGFIDDAGEAIRIRESSRKLPQESHPQIHHQIVKGLQTAYLAGGTDMQRGQQQMMTQIPDQGQSNMLGELEHLEDMNPDD
jgi:hypothetical protein